MTEFTAGDANVIGIVFYVGQHDTDTSDYTSTGIGQAQCHGYAVAIKDATSGYRMWGVKGTELGCCPTDTYGISRTIVTILTSTGTVMHGRKKSSPQPVARII